MLKAELIMKTPQNIVGYEGWSNNENESQIIQLKKPPQNYVGWVRMKLKVKANDRLWKKLVKMKQYWKRCCDQKSDLKVNSVR